MTLTEPEHVHVDPEAATPARRARRGAGRSMLAPAVVGPALRSSVTKLHPAQMVRNPVMFVVEVGSVLTSALFVADLLGDATGQEQVFSGLVALWLWATVLFANFAEALAEGRGKAQAASLRRTRGETLARRLADDGGIELVPSTALAIGDRCVVEAGELIPGDGDVVDGIATVDESAITGESAPVIRESGGDRSAVTGGTRVLSDRIVVRISSRPGETFLDRMIALVEGADRQKTPNEVALTILLSGLTIIFLLAVVTLQPLAVYSGAPQSVVVLTALLVCLIPTTIGGLLSAIGIAGMDRLVQRNVLAMSGRAVEAAGDVSTLLLDKTGTITLGNRSATELLPVHGVSSDELAEVARLSSLADETPEGRSIVEFAHDAGAATSDVHGAVMVPFTAQTRMSGVDLPDGRRVRKGATDAVRRWVEELAGTVPLELGPIVDEVSEQGGTPLVVAVDDRVLGVIRLSDVVKPGMRQRFEQLRSLGITTVMITGAQAAKEAGNMVDLDSDPTKLIEIVEIGKQLLITRGALTTFSISNDVAKYFAIIPAMFGGVLPALDDLNVMGLESARSAILSAVIFNALIIVVLVPLALRGVRFRATGAEAMLRRNLLVYGLGGLVAPFVGIKAIDLLLSALGVS